jgi:hypothetical protein
MLLLATLGVPLAIFFSGKYSPRIGIPFILVGGIFAIFSGRSVIHDYRIWVFQNPILFLVAVVLVAVLLWLFWPKPKDGEAETEPDASAHSPARALIGLAFLIGMSGLVELTMNTDPPIPEKAACELEEHFNEAKRGGLNKLIAYTTECSNSNTIYMIAARTAIAQIEYSDIRACIREKVCHARACLNRQTHLSVEQTDNLAAQATAQEGADACQSTNPMPVPTPAPIGQPSSLPKPPDRRDLIAWSNIGFNAETKKQVPIAVLSDGTGSVSDRIAKGLVAILKDSQFNITNPSDAALIVLVSADYKTADIRGAEFILKMTGRLRADWIGGKPAFSTPIEGTGHGPQEAAHDEAVQDAIAKLGAFFLQPGR